MIEMLRECTHVVKTTGGRVDIMSFNKRNDIVARFSYESRAGAISALERLTGRKVTLKPMQTEGAERVETHQELSDVNHPDE